MEVQLCILEHVLFIVFIGVYNGKKITYFLQNQYVCIVIIQSFINSGLRVYLKALLTNPDSPVVIIGGEFTCVPDIRTTHHHPPPPPPLHLSIPKQYSTCTSTVGYSDYDVF